MIWFLHCTIKTNTQHPADKLSPHTEKKETSFSMFSEVSLANRWFWNCDGYGTT